MKNSMIAVGWLVAGVAAIGAMVRAQEADDNPKPAQAAGGGRATGFSQPAAVVSGYRYEGGPATSMPAQPGFPGAPALPNFRGLAPSEPFIVGVATLESQAIGNALNKIKAAESDEEREAANSELREALADQFDKDIERRKQELEAVALKLKEMQAMLEKRVESAEKIIDLRMQVLLQDAEGLGWNNASAVEGLEWNNAATRTILRSSLPAAPSPPRPRNSNGPNSGNW